MAGPLYFDRVKETTLTTGTGSFTLAGAVAGFQSFAVVGNNNTCFYCCEGGLEWEVGLGTWTTGGTLARTTIIASSNANAAVSFSAGTKNVFITIPATQSGGVGRFKDYTVPGTYTWNVPAAIKGPWVWVTMIGGGSSGRGSGSGLGTHAGGYGGGSAEVVVRERIPVTPGAAITIVIGAGGVAMAPPGSAQSTAGGNTSFGSIVAAGAPGGTAANISAAGGGTTGGAGQNGGINGVAGTATSPTRWGGSSGGGNSGSMNTGANGGPNNGFPGGVGGTWSSGVGYAGSGGAASFFGPGGAGGNAGVNGSAPPSTSYGAGGGGAGGFGSTGTTSGAGAGGYMLIEWDE